LLTCLYCCGVFKIYHLMPVDGMPWHVYHHINVGKAAPIEEAPCCQRRITGRHLQNTSTKRKVQSHLTLIIDCGPHALCLCVNSRKSSALQWETRSLFPLLWRPDLIGLKFFSMLDVASKYWQVEVPPEDRPKAVLNTHCGLFKFGIMPF